MSGASPAGIIAPNFRTPRLLGIFSVVFASGLLIVGFCLGGYLAVLPMFGKLMDVAQNQINAQAEASRKAELDALTQAEKDADTAEKKFDIAVRRKELERRPKSPMSGMMEVNRVTMGDPVVIGYSWVDVLSGLVVNVMLLASGIGLLSWRPWARTLGVWTASLKILRLVLLYGFFIIAVVPPFAQRLGKAASELLAANPLMTGVKALPFATAGFYTRMYTVMYSGVGLGMMVIGSVFPALVLWFLTRPAVKSACSGRLKTPLEPNQPW